jgi:hypothetical protein
MRDLDHPILAGAKNTDNNHWVLLSVSIMYCDSCRLIDLKTGERVTCDFSDVMSVPDE